jgi:superfamily II DNA or RNA helicase
MNDLQESRIIPAEQRRHHPWQRECLAAIDITIASGGTDFLAAITPSGGKTILGLSIAHRTLTARTADLVVVLAPSIEIQNYWISEAAKFSDPHGGGGCMTFASSIKDGAHGVVFTYQALAGAGAALLADLCAAKRVFVIADEIHHGGMGKPWGDAVRRATEKAVFRLGLSGTPFRTDDAEIPILRYSGAVGFPHYEHSYGDALDDDVVAPVFFRWINGSVAFAASETVSFDESAQLSDNENARLLTTATKAGSEFSHELLAGAHSELMNCLATDWSVAGLVIAQDILAAKSIYKYLTQTLKVSASLVVSTSPGSHDRLEEFKTNGIQWLVSVGMVSEGVNIPRLKVLAYLSNDKTELAFVQAVGRLTRLMPGRDDQRVLVYSPKLASFERYAALIETARNHVIGLACEPGAPALRYCSKCGEPSPAGSSVCGHCGHLFPTQSTEAGAVVLSTNGFQDGLTLSGYHFTEANMDDVVSLYCSTLTHVAELHQEGRAGWCGRHLKTLADMARREGVTLDEKLRNITQALKAKGVTLYDVPDHARYAATPRTWRR